MPHKKKKKKKKEELGRGGGGGGWRVEKEKNIEIARDTLERLPGKNGVVSTAYLPAEACRAKGLPESRATETLKVRRRRHQNSTTTASTTAETATKVVVAMQRTLVAARAIVQATHGAVTPCALNFASAKNPGGGFQRGALAQEEALCRVSGLYNCIKDEVDVYALAKHDPRSGLYHDTCIFSPGVPVIKDDDGVLLPTPFRTSFLTCPAVNAGHARKCGGTTEAEIADAMRARIATLLAVAAKHDQAHLILGAFGTGVFKNAASDVAGMFVQHLTVGGAFYQTFKSVTFAVISADDATSFASAFHVPIIESDAEAAAAYAAFAPPAAGLSASALEEDAGADGGGAGGADGSSSPAVATGT